MAVRTAVYAYPWDLNGDPHAAERFAELGVDAVVLAAAYHSVRAATPRHPRHRLVDARSAALYMPVRPEAWGELIPADASPWAGERSFARAAGELRLVGLPVRAWVVLTHSTAVGQANPWACLRNAFGDVYPYALCPNVPAVREYARTLVGEVVRQSGVTDVVLEACGPMGVGHLGHHEKTAGADWSEQESALLSICFCDACTTSLAAAGADPGQLAARIRVGESSEAIAPELAMVLRIRVEATRLLRETVVAEAQAAGAVGIAMHAVADSWATGPAAAVAGPDLSSPSGVGSYVVPAWELGDQGVERVRVMRTAIDASVAAYVTVLPPTPVDPDVLAGHWRELVAAGADELHLYHAGLASDRRLAAMQMAIEDVTGKVRR
jgi:hypothetical protein